MSTRQADRLVDDYLRRLEAAAAHLQRSRRAELLAEIREHIEAALRQEDAVNEVAVRNVLERLGEPDEIVEAAEPVAATPTAAKAGALEIAALVALLVPLVGWVLGIVLVLASQAWAARDKVVGIALALLPALVPLSLIAVGAGSGGEEAVPAGDDRGVDVREDGSGGLGPTEFAVLGLLAGLPSVLYLGSRLRSRSLAGS